MQFVLLVGDSNLRAIADGFLGMPDGALSFGVLSIPGALAAELRTQVLNVVLPRTPEAVCVLGPSNNLCSSRTISEAGADFGKLLKSVCGTWPSVHLSDDAGMEILVRLLWVAASQQLERATEVALVQRTSPRTSPPARRVSPKVVVMDEVTVPRPSNPFEWTVVGRTKKVRHCNRAKYGKNIGVAAACLTEVETTVNSLPRPSAEAQLLQVKLRQKIKYKGYQHFYTVNMKNVLAGLTKLKETHPQYSDVAIDESATFESLQGDRPVDEEDARRDNPDAAQPVEPSNPDGEMETAADATDERRPSDADKEKEDLRPGLALDTCMQPPDIAQEVLSYGDGIFSVAPTQGNKPVGFFSTPKLEAMAFLVQFPTGRNTLDEDRQIKLSPSRYFNTRLFCVDTWFAKDQSYLFFVQFVTETHMATCSMSIQTRKGKKNAGDGRRISNKMLQDKAELEKLIQNKEATRFMQPLRGTPAYWEKTLRDLHTMPIGPVEDYLFRVEFQARGSPHIHMVVWIEDAPEVQDHEDCQDVIEFIDRCITCQMPDEKADPELHKIGSEVQVHS
ncbi:hypothetical protein AAFF_G00223140 [Aldrovandia affinis]|uniref:Helitron helicase-like domain-containing protein n=1 Tax=Aldrovandia affinis TaxID=143900 RepID=A0AAD7RFE3_9TELE|nr:hypothetical protein AAFF_G00223140 [Aldrovandia affinis]